MNKGVKICKIKMKVSSYIRYFIFLILRNFYICIWLLLYGIEIFDLIFWRENYD